MKELKVIMLLLSSIFVMSCSQDDNAFQATAFSLIDTDQGAKFTLTYPDGKERKISGSAVFGSFNGQLLNGNYYKSFNATAEGVRFDFKFSIPENTKSADVIEGTHQLRSQRLRLEQTGNLGKLETEFWLGTARSDDEFDGFVNAKGKATYQQDISANDKILDIVVEVEGSVVNRMGQTVKINGLFWKAKDDDIR